MSWQQRRADAKRLVKAYPGVVDREQAREVLGAVGGNYTHAEWVCQTCASAQQHFRDKLDPVQLAKKLAERQGWEPTL